VVLTPRAILKRQAERADKKNKDERRTHETPKPCNLLPCASASNPSHPSFSAGTVRYGVWTVDGRNIRRSNLLLLAVVRHLLQSVDRLRDLLGTVGFVNVKRAKEDS
jgi:hypothetical protein